jgi:inward rectifier potassium channel
MQRPAFDPGLTQKYTGAITRAINKDGTFNVRRTGVTWHDIHPYLFLINASWPVFSMVVMGAFLVVNVLFAAAYCAVGLEHLQGTAASTPSLRFLNAFFFSAHTLTTVGYGNMFPIGIAANAVAAAEALVGLMTFALATGLLFGRFSRPSARIGFSEKMVIAPYSEGTALQFRVVNRRSNNLINLEARVMIMTVEFCGDRLQRKYHPLQLERDGVVFFPLTWTIVHPIDENSPLFGKTPEDLEQLQTEVLVMLKGIDETFGQQVYARSSYRYNEIEWGAKFKPAFEIDSEGEMRLEVNRVSDIDSAP